MHSVTNILLIVYAMIILVALGGNLLVCVAIRCDRILRRQPENLFLVSLAVSDLLVSLLVMSFAASNDFFGYWPFGHLCCQLWICFDITCTTASILNLSAIALYRFFHISRPFYYLRRRKLCIVISLVWLISAAIGFTPIILKFAQRDGGTDDGRDNNVNEGKYNYSNPQCELRLKPLYASGSSMCSFVIPAALMVLLYTRLYLFARKHIKIMRRQLQQVPNITNTNVMRRFFSEKILTMYCCCNKNDPTVSERPKLKNTAPQHSNTDQKARITLGVIIGTFLICWLPFFVVNVIRSFRPALISEMQFKAVTWLGYANSTANPIIYTVMNRDFQIAFRKILFDNLLCSRRSDCLKCNYM